MQSGILAQILFLNDCARLGVPKLSMNETIGWAKSSPEGSCRGPGIRYVHQSYP